MRGVRAVIGGCTILAALCAPTALLASDTAEEPAASGGAVIAPGPGSGDEASASASTPGAKQANHDVAMRDFKFVPREIVVDVGDMVTFTNEDTAEHNAIAEDNSFRTSTFGQGESESVTISEPGSYPYFCSLHANMEGRISTTGSEPSGGGGSGGGGGTGGSGGGGGAGDGGAGSASSGDSPLTPGGSSAGSGSSATGTSAGSGSSSGGSLPATGDDSVWLAVLGVWLLAVGASVRLAVSGRV